MIIDNQGSVVVFQPQGDLEYEWLILNVDAADWQWQGKSLAVDHRYAEDLVEGIRSAGFVIEQP
jgi:hypothetical protein